MENLTDLSPRRLARALADLGWTREQIAAALGDPRAHGLGPDCCERLTAVALESRGDDPCRTAHATALLAHFGIAPAPGNGPDAPSPLVLLRRPCGDTDRARMTLALFVARRLAAHGIEEPCIARALMQEPGMSAERAACAAAVAATDPHPEVVDPAALAHALGC